MVITALLSAFPAEAALFSCSFSRQTEKNNKSSRDNGNRFHMSHLHNSIEVIKESVK